MPSERLAGHARRGVTSAIGAIMLLTGCADRGARPPEDSPAAAAESATESVAPAPAQLITASSIGPVAVGATLAEARRALPEATFERSSDGEGIALVAITLGPDETLTVWAEEDDADAPIDWSSRIRMIETRSPAFATAEGVRAGALVSTVAAAYGPIREVVLSEIESRQYVTFERQPSHLTFRLDYSGMFREGERTSKQVSPEATIHSIAIERRD